MANITPTTGDWSGLGIAAGDNIFVHQGTFEVTAGVDFSAVDRMAQIYFGPNCAPRFSTTFKVGTSGDFIIQSSGGYYNIEASCTGTGADTIAALYLQTNATLVDNGGGTITLFDQNAGSARIAEGTILTTYRKQGGVADVGYNATAITTFNQAGGSAEVRRSVTTATISGGSSVVFQRATIGATSSLAATTINIYDDSTVEWHGGAITTVNLYHPKSRFIWKYMRESVTIGTLNGHAEAIAATGLGGSLSTNTSTNGATVTVTNRTVFGGKPVDFYSGVDL